MFGTLLFSMYEFSVISTEESILPYTWVKVCPATGTWVVEAKEQSLTKRC